VKFLVDANLPPRLCIWLRSHRHEAEHLFDRNLLTATDTQIWEHGRVESRIILSKGTFTIERCCLALPRRLFMSPLATVATLSFSRYWPMKWADIERALVSGSRLISITLEKMEVFA
jgi:predicted nuclease of predicted toxin-antitoxin system